MAQKKSNTKELFTLRVKVNKETDKTTVDLSCEKDGKQGDFSLLDGDNLNMAYNSLMYAASLLANLLVHRMHDEGKMSDEEFYKLTSPNHEQANKK